MFNQNQMITTNEYNEALIVVIEFNKQLIASVENTNIVLEHKSKTKIVDWLYKNSCSVRLRNGLNALSKPYGDNPAGAEYIEDVTERLLTRYRNIGIKCWIEFNDIKNQTK